MNPELSILIPVRDEEENVKIISNKIEKEIINSNYELLFVNDFSEDDTIKVIEELKIHNNKIRFVNNQKKVWVVQLVWVLKNQGVNTCV